jgi:tartrate dehydrogenase/decarboxylase/D-malate dehydrogenase
MWAGALMLEHLGQRQAAERLSDAFADVLAADVRTGDLGGTATTRGFTDAVLDRIAAGS